MIRWHIDTESLSPEGQQLFASLDAVFNLQGCAITSDQGSDVILVQLDSKNYFVKRYTTAGKYLRRWLGRPRVMSEWCNLQRFAAWGIPTAKLVAYGLERRSGIIFQRGSIVTEEIPGTIDLLKLANSRDPRLEQRDFVSQVSSKVAEIARTLHAHRFAHNDLHWRNLLYQAESGKVFLIDCPAGRHWRGPMLKYRIAKDLAALDGTARTCLSRTQRLRFYLQYTQKQELDAEDKRAIRYIMRVYDIRQNRKKPRA